MYTDTHSFVGPIPGSAQECGELYSGRNQNLSYTQPCSGFALGSTLGSLLADLGPYGTLGIKLRRPHTRPTCYTVQQVS